MKKTVLFLTLLTGLQLETMHNQNPQAHKIITPLAHHHWISKNKNKASLHYPHIFTPSDNQFVPSRQTVIETYEESHGVTIVIESSHDKISESHYVKDTSTCIKYRVESILTGKSIQRVNRKYYHKE